MRMKKLLTFLTLLTLFFGVGWAETKTATFDFTQSQTSPVTVNGVTFSWTSPNIVTGGGKSSGFKANSSMTVTLPDGAILKSISKTNGNNWGNNATINVYPDGSDTPIASIVTGTNSYSIASNNTGGIFIFENGTSKNAWIQSLSITYELSAPIQTYNVACNQANNGSISVGTTTSYAKGATVTVSATPVDGYKLSTVTVTPTESGVTAPTATITGNTATFTMPASDVTVDATFAPITYVQYKLVENENELISGSDYLIVGNPVSNPYCAILGPISGTIGTTIKDGYTYDANNKTISIDENSSATVITIEKSSNYWTLYNGSGYLALTSSANNLNIATDASNLNAQWTIDTNELPSSNVLIQNNSYTNRYLEYNSSNDRFACYQTSSNQLPIALFKKVETGDYTVECADGIEHGSISASPSTADAGKTITVTATPDAGYELSTVTVTPTESGITAPTASISGNTATFTMPASNVTVSATFALAKNKVAYTIAPANSGEVWLQNGATYDQSLGYSYSTMGTTVSIALAAYAGYDVNSLTITDGNGANVTYNTYNTEWVDGKKVTYYTFVMPATQVNIAATFKSGDIYILGTANDNSWDGNKGVKMTYDANTNTYSADVYFATETSTGKGQFSFATNLSGTDGSWANIGKRWGAQEQDYDLVTNASGGTWTENNSNPNRFAVPYGVYTISVNWGTGLVTATPKEVTVSLNPAAGQVETGTAVTISSNLTSLLQACKSGVSATLAYSTDGENFTDGNSYILNSNTTLTGRATYGTIEKTAEATYTVVTHYAISCSANPTKGGSVKAYIGEDQVTSAIAGDVITLDVTTKNGYEISSVTLNGDELEAVNGVYSFTMPAEAAVVVANFAAKTLNLNVVNDNSKGTVAGIPATSTVGSPINFTVTPHSGYSVASVTYSFTPDGGEQNTQTLTATDGTYSFNMPGYDVTITVAYNEHSSGGTGSGDFTLVTSTDDLIAGREYIIVCQNVTNGNNSFGPYALSAPNAGTSTAQSNARAGVNDIELSNDNTICTAGSAEIFQLEGSEGAWKFHSSNGYLFGTSGQNYLNIGDEYADNWEVASITIQSGSVAKIQFNNDSRWIQCYNNSITATNGNVPYFACYSSNQKQVYLYYREVGLSDPVFTPAAGIYDIDVDVTIDCSTSGATIYYTTDGSEPSATNGTEYTGEIVVSETTTFKAIAIKDSEVSNVVTATYTISKSSTVETVFPTYSEPFTSGIGKFHVENGDGFSPVWTLDGNYGVKGTAYSNGTNYAATSRLISPIIDLSDASVPELTFSHQINSYFTDPTTQCQLFIRETTNGTSGTWVELDGLSFTTPASGTWSNDFADIDLSDYVGKKIQISFLYTNPEAGSGAGTWEIQNFVVADNSDLRWVNNIAEFNALEPGTKAKFRNPVTVLYDYSQYSKSTYQEYIWVKDESGYTQIFLQPSLDGQYNTNYQRAFYENGDVIPAGFEVIMNWYEEGQYYQAMSNSATEEDRGGFKEATEKALADPEPFTAAQLAQLNTEAATVETYNNRYISISKIRIASKSNLNFTFQDENGNGTNIAGYNKYSNTNSRLKDGETTAVVTVPDVSTTAYYNVTAILQTWQGGWEIMPITFTPWEEKTVTLRELCQDGVTTAGENEYTISNNLLGVYSYYDENLDADILWVKDDNGQSIHMVSPEAPYTDNFAIEFEDLLDNNDNVVIPANTRLEQQYYDQSNWCQLILTGKNGSSFVNKIINGGAIQGRFTDKLNPTLEGVTLTAADIYSTSSYTPNYYVPASFVGSQSCNTDMYGEEGHGDYFFMTPKPQEYATIVWAVWDGQKMNMPTKQQGNSHDLFGEFSIDLSMNQNHVTAIPTGAYSFHAIIRKVSTSGAPALKGQGGIQNNQSASYMVYPLDIDPDNNPSTAINSVNVNGKAVKSIKYVNVAGIVSDRPFQGVNIVVTEYTDGTRTTSKMLKR